MLETWASLEDDFLPFALRRPYDDALREWRARKAMHDRVLQSAEAELAARHGTGCEPVLVAARNEGFPPLVPLRPAPTLRNGQKAPQWVDGIVEVSPGPPVGRDFSIPEALARGEGEPMWIAGQLLERRRDGTFLCAGALPSYPPTCDAPVLFVVGLDPAAFIWQRDGSYTWVEGARLHGALTWRK